VQGTNRSLFLLLLLWWPLSGKQLSKKYEDNYCLPRTLFTFIRWICDCSELLIRYFNMFVSVCCCLLAQRTPRPWTRRQ
jgi:hypothetical protein